MIAREINNSNMAVRALGFIILAVFFNASFARANLIPPPKPDAKTKARVVEDYGRLPLRFEANQGQADTEARFVSRGPGYGLFLTSKGAVLSLQKPSKGSARQTGDFSGKTGQTTTGKAPNNSRDIGPNVATTLHMEMVGANPNTHLKGLDELKGKVNYFHGNDPKQWHSNIPTYAKVNYEAIYPGIDLTFYGNSRQLEYDFIVAPRADPRAIRLSIGGADNISLDSRGDLILNTAEGDVRLRKPLVYQDINGVRRNVKAHYVFHHTHQNQDIQVGFRVATYDNSRPLIIDPVLVYSTYLGGSNADAGVAIAVDNLGNAYAAGGTSSPDFPTKNAFQNNRTYAKI